MRDETERHIETINRWFAHIEAQRARAETMQRLATLARSEPEEARRRLSMLDRDPVVFDGATLEIAVRALLAHIRAKDERIAELEAENTTLRTAFQVAEDQSAHDTALVKELEAENERLRAVTVGAIPDVTDYARGWNDCRQAMFAARKAKEEP